MNNDKFLTNIIFEEYEYNDNFKKIENQMSKCIQENDATLSYKDDDVSLAVFAEFP